MPNTMFPASATGLPIARRPDKAARLRCPAVTQHGSIPPGISGTRQEAQQQALRDLCDFADILDLPGGAWLLVPVSPALLDVLAAFEADFEDLEESDYGGGDVCDEPHDECTDREPSLGSGAASENSTQAFWAIGAADDAE